MERICTVISRRRALGLLGATAAAPAFGQFQIGDRAFNYTAAAPSPSLAQPVVAGGDGIWSVQYGSNNTAGNKLIAFALLAGNAAVTISDSAGNTWTPVWGSVQYDSTTGYQLAAWTCTAVSYGSLNTVSLGGASGIFHGNLVISEWTILTALDASTPLPVTGNGATLDTGAFTLTGTQDVVFGFGRLSGGSFVLGSGFTSLWDGGGYLDIEYKVVTGSSANATGTCAYNPFYWGGFAVK